MRKGRVHADARHLMPELKSWEFCSSLDFCFMANCSTRNVRKFIRKQIFFLSFIMCENYIFFLWIFEYTEYGVSLSKYFLFFRHLRYIFIYYFSFSLIFNKNLAVNGTILENGTNLGRWFLTLMKFSGRGLKRWQILWTEKNEVTFLVSARKR